MDHIAEEQRKDTDISHMMDWSQREEPDEGTLALASPSLKHIIGIPHIFKYTTPLIFVNEDELAPTAKPSLHFPVLGL
ncbi:hypothetical protein PoB_006665100 [Plakobranchus ocellatus]|uniref:Uncharacterized protein n=1 Tax=Plakobranchus ocellatus TaxID=259542 RepID=A0AAV4D7X9_9GAST|nr:hypothetical protein PoB_006665100 [Plakobranchus ocellatus]